MYFLVTIECTLNRFRDFVRVLDKVMDEFYEKYEYEDFRTHVNNHFRYGPNHCAFTVNIRDAFCFCVLTEDLLKGPFGFNVDSSLYNFDIPYITGELLVRFPHDITMFFATTLVAATIYNGI